MMKALSIRQPWTWLIVQGYKDIENRTWSTKFRGEILVHAGLRFDNEGYKKIMKTTDIKMPKKESFERGGIIGSIEIIDCITQSDSPWFIGPYGFVLKNPQEKNFVPCKGQLGFFNMIE